MVSVAIASKRHLGISDQDNHYKCIHTGMSKPYITSYDHLKMKDIYVQYYNSLSVYILSFMFWAIKRQKRP